MTEAKKASRTSAAKPATATRAKTGATKATAPTKPATAKKPAAKATPKPAVTPRGARAQKPAAVAPEQRRNYVEVAAYYIAARRGFAPGDPLQDWIQAEAEVDRLLGEGLPGGLEG